MKKNNIKVFLVDESGAETVEWVIVCAGIAAAGIAVYSSTGVASLQDALNAIKDRIITLINNLNT